MADLEPARGGTWRAAMQIAPREVFAEGRRLPRRPYAGAALRAGEWDHRNGWLFVNTGGDARLAQVELQAREYAVLAQDVSHVEVSSLAIDTADWLFKFMPASAAQEDCYLHHCSLRNGWNWAAQAWHPDHLCTGVRFTDNEVEDILGSGLGLSRQASDGIIARNRLRRCATASKAETGSDAHDFTSAIHPGVPIRIPRRGHVREVVIEGNDIAGGGRPGLPPENGIGIWVDEVDAGIVVRRNRIANCSGAGLVVENSPEGGQVSANIMTGCGHGASGGGGFGIFLSRGNQDWLCAHNIVLGCHVGIALANYLGQGHACRGNGILNNISAGNVREALRMVRGGEEQSNRVSHNCFGAPRPGLIEWQGPAGHAYFSGTEALLDQLDGARIMRDAGLRDPQQGDFRLAADLPCRGRGVRTAVRMDFNGHPIGQPPDIGALAYDG